MKNLYDVEWAINKASYLLALLIMRFFYWLLIFWIPKNRSVNIYYSCLAILVILAISKSATAVDRLPLAVQLIPEYIESPESLKNYLVNTWPELQDHIEVQNLFVIVKKDNHTLTFYVNGRLLIQQSTLSDALDKVNSSRQFGRNPSIHPLDLWAKAPELKNQFDLAKQSIHFDLKWGDDNTERILAETNSYAGLHLEENERTGRIRKTILLSMKNSKHAAITLGHELQHVINQYVLNQILESLLPKKYTYDERILSQFYQAADEFLAIQAEIDTYKVLKAMDPWIVNTELEKLAVASPQSLKEHIINNYSRRLKWTNDVVQFFLESPLFFQVTRPMITTSVKQLRLRNDLRLPKSIRKEILYEQFHNDINALHTDYVSPKLTDLQRHYRPTEGNIFEIPFILLDHSELDILGEKVPQSYHEGEKIRFFIHPASLNEYRDLIAHHPLIYSGFVGVALASSRSLYVWNSNEEAPEILKMKLSLGSVISGRQRLVNSTEAFHATLMSAGLKQISSEEFEQLSISPEFEPTALIPKGFKHGMIIKEFRAEKGYFVPIFALVAHQKDERYSLLERLAYEAGLSVDQFAREEVVKPLLSALILLRDRFGFIPEAHGQNMRVQIYKNKIIGWSFRDLSGAACNLKIREKNKLSNEFILKWKNSSYFEKSYHIDRGENYWDKSFDVHFVKGIIGSLARSIAGDNTNEIEILEKDFLKISEQLIISRKGKSLRCEDLELLNDIL